MNIKKVLTFICLSFLGLFVLTSCGKIATTEHTHEFESTYSKDAEGHWYQAICEHTDEKKAFAVHTFGEYIVLKEATETEAGSKKQICSVCGYEHFEEIPKVDHVHQYASEYSKNEDGHWYQATCEHTNEKKDYATHTFGEYIVVKEATETESGSKKQICIVCGYEHFEEIPKLIHGFVDGVCPNCGLRYISEGLSYTLLEDGTYEVGLGECVEKYVYLPNEYNGIQVTKVEDYGFSESDIEGVLIPPGIITIGEYSFDDCSNLKEVVISKTVTAIGDKAFRYCYKLTKVKFETESKLETIGLNAFAYCEKLTEITIPANVTTIGDNAFRYCSKLTKVEFEEESKLETIGEYAFDTCEKLAEIKIPTNVTTIDKYAFNSCALTRVEFEENSKLEVIGKNAFSHCENLFMITLPSNLTKIGKNAFSDCGSLVQVVIPKNVTTIDDYAFEECKKLVEVYNLSGLKIDLESEENGYVGYYAKVIHTSLDEKSFISIDSEGFAIFEFEGNNYLLAYLNYDNIKDLVLPAKINNKSYDIYSGAFRNSKLESVVIPEGVTSIGVEAFEKSIYLMSVTLPSTLITIEDYAFDNCDRLFEIYNLSTLTINKQSNENGSVGYSAVVIHTSLDEKSIYLDPLDGYLFAYFDEQYHLVLYQGEETELILPESYEGSLYDIYARAFESTEIVSISIPSSVTSIGYGAFQYCEKLENVTIEADSNLESIDMYAFYGCNLLMNIFIPNSVKTLSHGAFGECTSLESVVFEEDSTLECIDDYTFYQCVGLTEITIPASVITLNTRIFNESSITTVLFEANSKLQTIEKEAFSGSNNLTEITIPASVTTIGDAAFNSCYSLEIVRFEANSNLNSIGTSAFGYCNNLTEITIPASLTKLGTMAFTNCESLVKVTFEEESALAEINNHAFDSCIALTEIVIPKNVTFIGSNVFINCLNLTIYCEATELPSRWFENWNSSSCPVYWYNENEPTGEGNYWHYVEGVITKWE